MPEFSTALKTNELKAKKYTTRTIGKSELEQIVALNSGGWYLGEIAKVTGRTPTQIENALWNEGYSPRSHKYEQVEVKKWVAMYTGAFDGLPMTFAEISRRTGYAYGTVQLGVLRSGIRDRHPAESRRLSWERRRAKKNQ